MFPFPPLIVVRVLQLLIILSLFLLLDATWTPTPPEGTQPAASTAPLDPVIVICSDAASKYGYRFPQLPRAPPHWTVLVIQVLQPRLEIERRRRWLATSCFTEATCCQTTTSLQSGTILLSINVSIWMVRSPEDDSVDIEE
ncbi:hypothetical protein K438DRAFT_1757349 [Mycena galopus ATCC 62051]|nr:hypothetical protein K438DRAFT_1757349 [Mycena galopus ATCC 62051]